MRHFAATIFALSFVACLIFLVQIGIWAYKDSAAASSPVPSVRQQTYTSWNFDGRETCGVDYRFEISPGSVIIRYDYSNGGGSTSVYSGRWSGDYFIARQSDTIMRLGMDTVFMYPECHRIDFYTR